MAMADLIGTTIVAGILILMMMGLTGSVSESTTQQMLDVTTQQALSTIENMVEYDFHKMGFEAPGAAITVMGGDNITFSAGIDTNGDGVSDGVNTITYQLSGTSVASSTPNPNDRVLYRTVGAATPVAVCLGVTAFGLQYYDKSGNITANPANVKAIEVSLTVQSTMPYDNNYSEAVWKKMISPRNL
jgi:RNase P/RNase MRP subunit p29